MLTVRALKRRLFWQTTHARRHTVELLSLACHDPEPLVRKDTIIAFGKTNQIQAIPFLLTALKDPSDDVSKKASRALQHLSIWVYTVVFGDGTTRKIDREFTLHNPDVSHLTIPFTNLRKIAIHADHCDHHLLIPFLQYLQQSCSRRALRTHVVCKVDGNIGQGDVALFNPLMLCKQVTVASDRIIFGNDSAQQYRPNMTLQNPDFAECIIPLSRLNQVIIYPETAPFHHLERFLTYAINYVGQKRLKNSVTVECYGDPEKLHPNIRNNLTNLCACLCVH